MASDMIAFAVTTFVAIFAIVNPLNAPTFFVVLTRSYSNPAFGIAGVLLLFSIAFAMMQGERSRTQLTAQDRQEALEREAVGITPLGIPLFAGHGAITTVMVLMAEASETSL